MEGSIARPRMWTVRDTATQLGYPMNTKKEIRSGREAVYRLIRSGHLQARQMTGKPNGKKLVTEESLSAYINESE
jgi:hypothetical protein